ncbi:hypothetical protein OH77DRAFT_1437001 [Trametes cingulata]|nr:hypothetical protein OH77DRAFT_1437001 [Trametes cingulata]
MSSGSPQLIDDTNPRVQYQPGWEWDQGVAEVDATRHGALTAGLKAWLSFTGTGVQVVGTLGPSNTNGQPKTTYTIDNQVVGTYEAPFSESIQYNVTFFASGNLPDGDHVILINNTDGTRPNAFWLDYFLIYTTPIPDSTPGQGVPPPSTSSSPSPTISTTQPQSPKSSSTHSGSSSPHQTSSEPAIIPAGGSANQTTASQQMILTTVAGVATTVTLAEAASQASSSSTASAVGNVSSTGSHSNSDLAAIVGAVAGAVAVILIVVLFFLVLRQRRRKANEVVPFHFSQEQFASRSRVTSACESPTKVTRRPYNDYGSLMSLPSGSDMDTVGSPATVLQRSAAVSETAPPATSRTDDNPIGSGPLAPLRRSPSPPPSPPSSAGNSSSSDRSSKTNSFSRPRRTASPSPIRFAPRPESPRMSSTPQTPASAAFPTTASLVDDPVPPGLWHAPPGMHSRAQSLLRSVFSRGTRSNPASVVPVVQDTDSGLRLYDETVLLPPPYTQD